METIHVKTVDPISQDLLVDAAGRGIDLNWERHEKLQPQDGFHRAGLSCPFGCLDGPCRIDPFGRGADRGSCGLDRDAMVAATLLRLSLSGAMEALAGAADSAPVLSGPLGDAAAKLGGGTVTASETFAAAAALRRPGEAPEALIRRALRLGLLTLGATGDTDADGRCSAGYGVLAGKDAVIGMTGTSPAGLARELAATDGMTVVSLGDWIAADGGFLPSACTSGEAELTLSSGRVDLVVSGAGSDPAIATLCAKLGIPLADGKSGAAEIAAQAKAAGGSGAPSAFAPDAGATGEGTMVSAASLKKAVGKSGLALIGGADSPAQPLGWIASEVAPALRAKDLSVATWGDAALWLLKAGQAGSGVIAGPQTAVAAGLLKSIRGICFTGLKDCRDVGMALGLAALGLRVCVATPLPLWGSKAVMAGLSEALAGAGGSLTHFATPPGANDVLEWFNGGE